MCSNKSRDSDLTMKNKPDFSRKNIEILKYLIFEIFRRYDLMRVI